MKWDHIRYYLKGIGKRVWFLHNLDTNKKLCKREVDIQSIHYESFKQKNKNLIVSLYEGIINESIDYQEIPYQTDLLFGRSLYCNYKRSYYIGYFNGPLDRHSKGIMWRRDDFFMQGFWTENKIKNLDNQYVVVDMKTNINDRKREEKLLHKIKFKEKFNPFDSNF